MITVYSNGEVIGTYDKGTQGQLAIKVARALMNGRHEVMVLDDGQHINEAGEVVDGPYLWQRDNLVSRGRPKLHGRVVPIRMSEEDIARAAELGHGDVAKGIAIALRP